MTYYCIIYIYIYIYYEKSLLPPLSACLTHALGKLDKNDSLVITIMHANIPFSCKTSFKIPLYADCSVLATLLCGLRVDALTFFAIHSHDPSVVIHWHHHCRRPVTGDAFLELQMF